MFKKAKESRLYEDVVRQIRELISEGTLKTGDLLPGEEELAKSIGVSRATVREGLRVLELVGMIKTRKGKGTIVTALTPQVIQQKLAFAINEQGKFLLYDLMQVREMFEPEVARLAASEISNIHIEEIEASLKEMIEDIANGGTGEVGSLKFHYAMINSINNPVITQIMTSIIDLQRESRSITLHIPGRSLDCVNEHRKILTAIKEGKGEEAAFQMKVHLNNTKEALEKILVKSD